MLLNEETRRSKTQPRTARITPRGSNWGSGAPRYDVQLIHSGRLITRTFSKRVQNLTEARTVAREWCA